MRRMASRAKSCSREQTRDLTAQVQAMVEEHNATILDLEDDDDDDLDDAYFRHSLPTLDTSHLEKALRAVIASFGLLVGLSWEKAFDAAGEAIIEGVPFTASQPVVAKVVMALILVIMVLPGWQAFIVPMAQKRWQEHEALMAMESCQKCAGAELADGSESAAAIRLLASGDKLSDRELVVILQRLVANRRPIVRAKIAKAMEDEPAWPLSSTTSQDTIGFPRTRTISPGGGAGHRARQSVAFGRRKSVAPGRSEQRLSPRLSPRDSPRRDIASESDWPKRASTLLESRVLQAKATVEEH